MRKIFQRRICAELQQPMKSISPSKPPVKPLAQKPWKMLSAFSLDSLQTNMPWPKKCPNTITYTGFGRMLPIKNKGQAPVSALILGQFFFLVLPNRGWYINVSEGGKGISHQWCTQQTWNPMLRQIFGPPKNLHHPGEWTPLAKPPKSVTVSKPGNKEF